MFECSPPVVGNTSGIDSQLHDSFSNVTTDNLPTCNTLVELRLNLGHVTWIFGTLFCLKFFYIYIYLFIYLSDEHTAQHSVCENLHSLEVYRQCQIDDVQTAAERAVRGFYKELRG